MGAGIWNLVFGIGFIVGGLSGKLVLFGTQSTTALTVVGVVMAGWGASQIWRSRKQG
ncbi:MAG: hypothetical protein HY904_24005 [Deltaproteobacteria bacterium]|nr:hypothetical protein [Deltaproteobacteria bacterium]